MHERRRAFVAAIAIATATMVLSSPRSAQAQTEPELQAARELFNDAFKDEQEKRYDDALEKYQRVAKVKESPQVRYRIAIVLAALGRLREARDAFRALAASRDSLPAKDRNIADSAAEKADELTKKIPKLSVRLQDNPPEDARVTVDGAAVPASTSPRVIELDPGPHVVAGTAKGAKAEETITLKEGGGETPHVVTFTPTAPEKPPVPQPEHPPEHPPDSSKRSDALPWVAIGVGGALMAAGGVLFIVREGTISDIEKLCPNNVCPTATRAQYEDLRDEANLYQPLGAGFLVGGAIVAGLGVYLLLSKPKAPAQAPASAVTWRFTPRGLGTTGGDLVVRF